MIFAVISALGMALASGSDELERFLERRTPQQLIDAYLGWEPFSQELARRQLMADPESAHRLILARVDDAGPWEQALLFDMLADLAVETDLGRLEAAVGSSSATVRAAVGDALARLAPEHPAHAALLDDAVPSVVERQLRSIRRGTLPVRAAFADRHTTALGRHLTGPDPTLRRLAIDTLVTSDQPQTAETMTAACSRFSETEWIHLVDLLVQRTPRWPAQTLRTLLRDLGPEYRLRTSLILTQAAILSGRPAPVRESCRELLQAALDGGRRESDAALSLFALKGPTPELIDALPAFEGHDGFGEAVTLVLQLRGPDALEDLVELFAQLDDDARSTILGQLHRLHAAPTAIALRDRILPNAADVLVPRIVECALQLPVSSPRHDVLWSCLKRLPADGRTRTFEGLCQNGNENELPRLIEALRATLDPTDRQRMTQLLAQAFGPAEPQQVLDLLSDLMNSPEEEDRVGALTALPFVALGNGADDIAAFLLERFRFQAPDRLVVVLGQIGGPVSERGLSELYASEHESHVALRPFFLQQAGRMTGAETRRLLIGALDSSEEREREEAYRSLIQRSDEVVLERGVEILLTLPSLDRAPLLRELHGCRHLPGMREFLAKLLPRLEDDDSRAAGLELGAPRHAELVHPAALEILDAKKTSVDLRDAALSALGLMPTTFSDERLSALISPLLDATAAQLVRLEDAPWILARAAAIARRSSEPAARARELAEVLVRGQARSSFWDLRDWVLEDRKLPVVGDSSLIARMGTLPPQLVIAALETALSSISPLDATLPEGFFLSAADHVRHTSGADELARWFESRPATRWPLRTKWDLVSHVRRARQLHPWPTGDFAMLSPTDLRPGAELRAAFADVELAPRELAMLFHRTDAFFGWNPRRTLDTASWLVESAAQHGDFTGEALRAASREAGHHGILLAGLCELATPRDPELAAALARRCVTAAPYLPYALGSAAWVHHRQGRTRARDLLRDRIATVLRSGLTSSHPVAACYEAAYLLDDGRTDQATILLGQALRARPQLAPWIRRIPGFETLREHLRGDGG